MNIQSFMFEQVYLWYPLNLITGGTTAKIMVAAKDNFLGKYIYKDTLARNIAAVIYRVSSFFTVFFFLILLLSIELDVNFKCLYYSTFYLRNYH